MIKVLVDIVCTTIEIGLLAYIYHVFFGKVRVHNSLAIGFYVLLGCTLFLISYLELNLVPKMAFTLLLAIFPAVIYYNNILAKLFVGAVFWATQLSCEFMSWAFLSLITSNLHEPIVVHEIDNYIQGVFLSKAIAVLIIFLIASLKKQNKYYGQKKLLCAFFVLPIITTVSLNQLAYATAVLQTTRTHEKFLLVAAFMILANAILFYLFDRQMDAEKIRREYELITQRSELEKEYYSGLIRRDMEVSKINHDMKNHISFLQYQLESHNEELALKYLNELSQHMVYTKVRNTGNITIDAIINIKRDEAITDNIVLDVEVPAPIDVQSINEMELVIILANCLDNAIEAVKNVERALKAVKLFLQADENGLIISVTNPVQESVDVENLQSTKMGYGHGLGLKNIKNIIEKYEGNIQLKSEEKQFQIKIYIPQKDRTLV